MAGGTGLAAVSGVTQLDASSPDIVPLNDILRWAMLSEDVVHVGKLSGTRSTAHSGRACREVQGVGFASSGMVEPSIRSLAPADDMGAVGIMGMKSRDPGFHSYLLIWEFLAGYRWSGDGRAA